MGAVPGVAKCGKLERGNWPRRACNLEDRRKADWPRSSTMFSYVITRARRVRRVHRARRTERANCTRSCSNCAKRPGWEPPCALTNRGAWTSASTGRRWWFIRRRCGTGMCARQTPRRSWRNTLWEAGPWNGCAWQKNASTQGTVRTGADATQTVVHKCTPAGSMRYSHSLADDLFSRIHRVSGPPYG